MLVGAVSLQPGYANADSRSIAEWVDRNDYAAYSNGRCDVNIRTVLGEGVNVFMVYTDCPPIGSIGYEDELYLHPSWGGTFHDLHVDGILDSGQYVDREANQADFDKNINRITDILNGIR